MHRKLHPDQAAILFLLYVLEGIYIFLNGLLAI